ncbi:MAG: SIS domain-containing protein [Brevundimonas sp.]
MMSYFPDREFEDCGAYAAAYLEQIVAAWRSLDADKISAAGALLSSTLGDDRRIFSCGNGGSAAIANHLLCDWLKGVRTGTHLKPKVHTLSSSVELITALANDIGVEEIFSYPLVSLAQKGDLLIAISSSGASPNIVRAVEQARFMGLKIIALTGFDGSPVSSMADVSLHVSSSNYGVVEDVHQSLMHVLAQFVRHRNVTEVGALGAIKF